MGVTVSGNEIQQYRAALEKLPDHSEIVTERRLDSLVSYARLMAMMDMRVQVSGDGAAILVLNEAGKFCCSYETSRFLKV